MIVSFYMMNVSLKWPFQYCLNSGFIGALSGLLRFSCSTAARRWLRWIGGNPLTVSFVKRLPVEHPGRQAPHRAASRSHRAPYRAHRGPGRPEPDRDFYLRLQ